MRIDLSCGACDANNFQFPVDGDGNEVVRCGECGHEVGTIEALKEKVAEEVLRLSGYRGKESARDG